MPHRVSATLAACIALLPAFAAAQPDNGPPPAPNLAEEAAVRSDAAEPARTSAIDWRLSANLQLDGLGGSDLPSDRRNPIELRRARVGGSLQFANAWRLTASADFAHQARIRDAFAEYRGERAFLALGRFPEPFGLAAGEGSRTQPLMERPQPTALGPGYGLGAAVNLRGDNWGSTLGYFAATGSPSDDDVLTGARKESALTGRLTGTPWRGEDAVLHLGASGSWRSPKSDAIRFIAIPETVLLDGMAASTGALPGVHYRLFGLEAALREGPLLLQSEFIGARFPKYFDQAPFYNGWYVEGAWAITGERRDYSTRRGVFGPVTPEAPALGPGYRTAFTGATGAWELAARYSRTDLSDSVFGSFFEGDPDQEAIDALFRGRQGRVLSAGVNWYARSDLRATLEALSIDKTGDTQGESAWAVQLRVAAQFAAP